MDIYICPMCGQENGEHQKYCLNCGTWLLNPTFPAKRKEQIKKKSSRIGFSGIIILLAIVGAVWYFGGNSAGNPLSNKIVFDRIDVGPFTFSQLEITSGVKSSIAVDLTVREASSDPIEIAAVFYAKDGTRIGRASTIVTNQLPAGHVTTLNLKLDEPKNLMSARSVRMEITPLTPIQLLEKAVDRIKEIPGG